jgi:hypothetical protein
MMLLLSSVHGDESFHTEVGSGVSLSHVVQSSHGHALLCSSRGGAGGVPPQSCCVMCLLPSLLMRLLCTGWASSYRLSLNLARPAQRESARLTTVHPVFTLHAYVHHMRLSRHGLLAQQ